MKTPLSCVALGLFAAAFFSACTTTPSAPPVDAALLDPAKNSAIRPEPRDPNWVKRHEGLVEEAKKGGVDLLFLGDSITDFWRRQNNPNQGGWPVWEKNYAPLHALNLGI